MTTRTIQINDTLDDIISGLEDDLRTAITDYLDENDATADDYLDSDELDYDGRIHELVDSAVPVYDSEIKDLWYLYSGLFISAFDDAGLYSSPSECDNYQQVAIYCYLDEKAREFIYENYDEIAEEHLESEEEDDDYTEYTVPVWSASAIVNGDYTSFSLDDDGGEERTKQVDEFLESLPKGSTIVWPDDIDDESYFTRYNDMHNLADTCVDIKVYESDDDGYTGSDHEDWSNIERSYLSEALAFAAKDLDEGQGFKTRQLLSLLRYTAQPGFTMAQALYWLCTNYHSGQGSQGYKHLSTSNYQPSVSETQAELMEIDQDFCLVYEHLEYRIHEGVLFL